MMEKKIHGAILAIAKSLQTGIEKSRNTSQYKFRGVEDFLKAISPELTEHKVLLIPSVTDMNVEVRQLEKPGYNGGPAKIQQLTKSTLTLHLKAISTEDGSELDLSVTGEGEDYGDKATPKAISMAWKYATMLLFCIPTENVADQVDDDAHSIDNRDQVAELNRLEKAINSATSIDRLAQLKPYAEEFNLLSLLESKLQELSK